MADRGRERHIERMERKKVRESVAKMGNVIREDIRPAGRTIESSQDEQDVTRDSKSETDMQPELTDEKREDEGKRTNERKHNNRKEKGGGGGLLRDPC